MYNIMVVGAGKIGRLIACFLADSGDYNVYLVDQNFSHSEITQLIQAIPEINTVSMDINKPQILETYLKKHRMDAVVSSLPYFLNVSVATAAKHAKTHYFDLTEDHEVTSKVKELAANAETVFVPQCGLAPGFISIAANSLMKAFDQCFHAKLRVGALPQHVNNALHYSLTWSTEGLINEYSNLCYGIESGKLGTFKPLEGLEVIQIEGCEYEAFNTSGGLGSLAELYEDKIQSLNYKTVRYPGHCEKMKFLMQDLQLGQDRDTLKRILERAIPATQQDLALIYITIEGLIQGRLVEKNYFKKIYPALFRGLEWSAIQVATASSLCVVVDLVLTKPDKPRGLLLQENIDLGDVLTNRFGRYYV